MRPDCRSEVHQSRWGAVTADDRGLHAAVGTLVCKKKIFFLVFSKFWKSQAKIENIFNTNLLCLQPNSFYVTEGSFKEF